MVSRNALRVVLAIAAGAVLASCSSSSPSVGSKRAKEFFSEAQYGRASPRVIARGPVPKGGGRALVGAPYRVAGKTYIPSQDPDYSETGYASWYGSAFHGRLTANGEVYDVNGLTAAHPTLPLPSYARVTNLANGKSLIVRVNDRGPFARNRIIDLSSRVADMLDVKGRGTAKVRVDYMGPARMDGLDERTLLASYRERGGGFSNRNRAPAPGTILVAAAPQPRVRPVAFQPAVAGDDPFILVPAVGSDDAYADDPIAPLIMRSSFASGYAAYPPRTGAQQAADALATSNGSDLQAALDRAAARKAQQLGGAPAGDAGIVVQIGSFANAANAERVARDFDSFGAVETAPAGSLTAVRVAVSPFVSPEDVISAATEKGLTGAFVVAR